jgi:hypothetical protein
VASWSEEGGVVSRDVARACAVRIQRRCFRARPVPVGQLLAHLAGLGFPLNISEGVLGSLVRYGILEVGKRRKRTALDVWEAEFVKGATGVGPPAMGVGDQRNACTADLTTPIGAPHKVSTQPGGPIHVDRGSHVGGDQGGSASVAADRWAEAWGAWSAKRAEAAEVTCELADALHGAGRLSTRVRDAIVAGAGRWSQ